MTSFIRYTIDDDDSETLEYEDPSDAVYAWLEFSYEDGRNMRSFAREHAPFKLHTWEHKNLDSDKWAKWRAGLARSLCKHAIHALDDEMGDPEGVSSFEGVDTALAECHISIAIRTLINAATPWQCEIVSTRTLTADEFLELGSDWFE